jgi:hypothetical protein
MLGLLAHGLGVPLSVQDPTYIKQMALELGLIDGRLAMKKQRKPLIL